MKKLILAAITLTSAASVFAQGTVLFNNRLNATSHVYGGPDNSPAIQGNTSADSPGGSTVYPAGYVLIGASGTGGRFGAATTLGQLLGAPGSAAAESSLLPSSS